MPIGRMGRPGLIATAARTAVIAGTAQATAGAVASRQQARAQSAQAQAAQAQAAQAQAVQAPPVAPPAAPPPPAAAAEDDLIAQLERLAQLQAAGALTPEEFAAAKARLLA